MAGAGAAKLLRFLTILYFAEAGAFLALSPWSRYWIRRVVARSPDLLQPLLASPFFRSFLVGLGLLHIWIAIRDLESWRRGFAPRLEAPGEETP